MLWGIPARGDLRAYWRPVAAIQRAVPGQYQANVIIRTRVPLAEDKPHRNQGESPQKLRGGPSVPCAVVEADLGVYGALALQCTSRRPGALDLDELRAINGGAGRGPWSWDNGYA